MASLGQHRSRRAAELEGRDSHFLRWDSELLTERALDECRGWEWSGGPVTIWSAELDGVSTIAEFSFRHGSFPLPNAGEWRAGTLKWLSDSELGGGGWCAMVGQGSAHATAIGCLLLAPND